MPPWAAEGSKLFRDIRGHTISVEKGVKLYMYTCRFRGNIAHGSDGGLHSIKISCSVRQKQPTGRTESNTGKR